MDTKVSSSLLPIAIAPSMPITSPVTTHTTSLQSPIPQLTRVIATTSTNVTTPIKTSSLDSESKNNISEVYKKGIVDKPHVIKSTKGDGVVLTRTSQRQIKRPKTDEELIDFESSSRGSTIKKPKVSTKTSSSTINTKSSSAGQKKTSKPKLSSAAKDLGRWRPTDDLMLISAVLQTNDLAAVHLGVKFSCRFTLREVEERWYALLYEPQISKLAIDAARGLHPGVVTMTMNNALWSLEEETLLAKIPSTDPGHLETFQKVLADNPAVFHPCRSATSLHHHWVLMGHYSLLSDQHVDVVPPGDNVVNFSDAEDLINDIELMKQRDVHDEALSQESMLSDRHAKLEIRNLEEELPVWREILDLPDIPQFEPGVLAILKGRVVQFMMRTNEVSIGRSSATSQVTFDLSLEGPAFKISRTQATLRLTPEGVFTIKNEGRRPIYIGGNAIVTGEVTQLQHNQVLEVATFSLLILINQKLPSSKN